MNASSVDVSPRLVPFSLRDVTTLCRLVVSRCSSIVRRTWKPTSAFIFIARCSRNSRRSVSPATAAYEPSRSTLPWTTAHLVTSCVDDDVTRVTCMTPCWLRRYIKTYLLTTALARSEASQFSRTTWYFCRTTSRCSCVISSYLYDVMLQHLVTSSRLQLRNNTPDEDADRFAASHLGRVTSHVDDDVTSRPCCPYNVSVHLVTSSFTRARASTRCVSSFPGHSRSCKTTRSSLYSVRTNSVCHAVSYALLRPVLR